MLSAHRQGDRTMTTGQQAKLGRRHILAAGAAAGVATALGGPPADCPGMSSKTVNATQNTSQRTHTLMALLMALLMVLSSSLALPQRQVFASSKDDTGTHIAHIENGLLASVVIKGQPPATMK